MKYHNSIMVMGDIHGDWGSLNTLVNTKQPDLILQCGDFGYWPRMDAVAMADYHARKHNRKGKAPTTPRIQKAKLHWCDGNHEDFEKLDTSRSHEAYPGCNYMPRGSTMALPDGRVVLFAGGAASVDKHLRVEGVSWFPQEEISHKDMEGFPDPATHIDIVISHTCPKQFPIKPGRVKANDWSQTALSYVLETYRPSLWYFGHWHQYMTGYTMGCRWTGLSCTHEGSWWEWLKS